MLDPDELYVVHQPDGQDPAGAWRDRYSCTRSRASSTPASAGRLLRDHLLENFEHRLVASFDVDQLLDYRSRRPTMVFVENHWVSYEEPALLLHVIEDAAGVPFLLLEGAEPDVQWERFLQAVLHLVKTLDVRLSIGVHGIPMGLPHTRPTGVTAHGTSLDLVAGHPPWIGTVQVPGSVGNLLEYRLGQAGHDAMGFAVHVPHYLAQTDYPDAARALLESVAKAADLTLPGEALGGGGRAGPRRDRRAGGPRHRGGGGGGGAGAAVRRLRRHPGQGQPADRPGRLRPHGRRARSRARALPRRADPTRRPREG